MRQNYEIMPTWQSIFRRLTLFGLKNQNQEKSIRTRNGHTIGNDRSTNIDRNDSLSVSENSQIRNRTGWNFLYNCPAEICTKVSRQEAGRKFRNLRRVRILLTVSELVFIDVDSCASPSSRRCNEALVDG